MKRIDSDHYVLTTGREIFANCGFVGINARLELSHGYDGDIETFNPLTVAERYELAIYMIRLWLEYASNHIPQFQKQEDTDDTPGSD
jgi:hypothetical protein